MAGFGFGKMQLQGMSEVEAMLRELPVANAKRVVKTALRAGARVVKQTAHDILYANGSVDTGLLANTLTITEKKGDQRGSATVTLRASGKLKMVTRKGQSHPTKARPSKYAHLIEFGTEHSKAEPFLRPAVARSARASIEKIQESSARGISREAIRLGANAKVK